MKEALVGMKIIGITTIPVTIGKIYHQDFWRHWDIEFEDTKGNYRHWKQEFDGGNLINEKDQVI